MIPNEAVEAAMDVVLDDGLVLKRSLVHDLLEAAAPHLMAEAWELGMVSMYATTSGEWPLIPEQNPYRRANV